MRGAGGGALDPRARLGVSLAWVVAAFAAGLLSGGLLLVLGVLLVAPLVTTRTRLALAALVVFGGVFGGAFLNLFLLPGETPWFTVPLLGASVTREAAERALGIGLRVANLGLSGLFVGLALRGPLVAETIGALLVPLERVFGARVHTASFQLQVAARFVPLLVTEGRRVSIAQRLRGLSIGRSPLSRARALPPLFVPVFTQALLRASRFGLLLAARGYRPGMARPHLAGHRFGVRDAFALASAVVATAFVVIAG